MPITIGQSVDHGFDQPLDLLSDCHRRIERFLGVLSSVARSANSRPLADRERQAIEGARRYFASAGPRHTADEEVSLFPRLREALGGRRASLLDALRTLDADHRRAERLHADADALLNAWLTADTLSAAESTLLLATLQELADLYGRHIAFEDGTLFPAAAEVLPAEVIEAIGREMAARRNVPFEPPAGLAGGRHP